MPSMDSIHPKEYRRMRTEVLDRVCEKLEREAPAILERCERSQLLNRARRMYLAGGSPLSDDTLDKKALIHKIVRAAEVFITSTVERTQWIGDFESERARVEAAAEQELEGWMSRFADWANESP
jgi:hypothetical protein